VRYFSNSINAKRQGGQPVCPPLNINYMEKVKFLKNFVHGNGKVDKKGSTRLVTSRNAEFLERNGFAQKVGAKENKEAAKRETK